MENMKSQPSRDSGEYGVRLIRTLEQHRAAILGCACAILRDFHLAEDVYQEVAVELTRRIRDLPEGAPLTGWIRVTARHKALQALHRQARVPLLSREILEMLGDEMDLSAPADDRRDRMRNCLAKLPPEIRRVVEGRYADGLDCQAIADRIGRSVHSVYAVLKRARLALASCIERAMPPGSTEHPA
jgi:RNA polymerase sigma-70 factor (ECF subfamily)